MQIKGKQIKNGSVKQEKLNITTNSILSVSSVTNAEYVNTNSVNRVEALTYATLNMNMQANVATIGDLACDKYVVEFPISNVMVKVNNINVTVGEGKDCYFSPDGGTTIRTGGQAMKGDYLYWNSTRFDLDTTDEIDFVYITASEPVVLSSGTTVELDPYYPALNVKYVGETGTTMTVVIDGVSFIVGNVADQFVWDVGGLNEHTFTTVGENWLQVVNTIDYTIWYDGLGSLLFSLKKGDFFLYPIFIIKASGWNINGQLGMGNLTNYSGAIVTTSFTDVKKVSTSSSCQHSFIIHNNGTIKSFGQNTNGQLGMGNTTNYSGAIQTPSFTNVKDVACGSGHTVILFKDGTIKSFGLNTYGQLGMGNTTNYSGAIQTPSFTNVKDVACGWDFTIILFDDGTIKSFGRNSGGQLGMGNLTNYNGVIQIPDITNVKDVTCGDVHTFLILNDNTVKSFGVNSEGQLGKGTLTNYNGVIQTPSFSNVKNVACGDAHTVVILNDNTIKTFGRNSNGQLGFGNTANFAGAIGTPTYTNVNTASCGHYCTILLFNDGTIKSFGDNSSGQLGMGTLTNYNGVIQTPSFTDVKKIACSYGYSFFII